jgi:osmotically-inducible protein OsmY
MKRPLYLLSLGLAAALAAAGQTGNQSQTQTPPVNPSTPATQVGSGAQTKAGTPASSSTTTPAGQVNPTGTGEPPSAQGTAPATGGVGGAASSSTVQTPAGDNSASGVASVSDSDLEGQIQNALNKEPTLTGDSTHVKVSADSIELNGNVNSNKEKVTATRIVQSYAGSRKLVNNLTVSGRTSNTTAPRAEQDQTDRSGVSSSPTDRNGTSSNPNPATNPEPQKGSKPPRK